MVTNIIDDEDVRDTETDEERGMDQRIRRRKEISAEEIQERQNQAATNAALTQATQISGETVDRQSIMKAIARKTRSRDVHKKEFYKFDGGIANFGPNRVEDTGINKTIVIYHKGRNFLFEGFEIPFELKELFKDFSEDIVGIIRTEKLEKQIFGLAEKLKKTKESEQIWYKQLVSAERTLIMCKLHTDIKTYQSLINDL